MSTKAILFDFDGTLADSAPGIVRTMEETFRRMNLPVPAVEDMKATIGMPLRDALQMLNGLTESLADEATATYQRLFPEFECRLIGIFPEVRETLQWLSGQGFRLAIATSRGAESLDMILARHNIGHFFEARTTNSDNLPHKPAPDMVNVLLQRMGLRSHEAILVGDTTYDIGMGNAAGCKTVAVTYGNHSKERLLSAQPTFVIDSLGELKALLR